MFFKIAKVKTLMKQAYSGSGLVVGRDDKSQDAAGYYISGSGWTIWNDERLIPNSLLAAIVEYCGCLPEHGEQFVVRKGEEGCQQEIQDPEMHLPQYSIKPGKTWELTPLYIALGQIYRVMQTSTGNLETVVIPQRYTELVSPEEVDKGSGETNCQGPYVYEDYAIWQNNVCWFRARTYREGAAEDLLVHLDEHRINGET